MLQPLRCLSFFRQGGAQWQQLQGLGSEGLWREAAGSFCQENGTDEAETQRALCRGTVREGCRELLPKTVIQMRPSYLAQGQQVEQAGQVQDL